MRSNFVARRTRATTTMGPTERSPPPSAHLAPPSLTKAHLWTTQPARSLSRETPEPRGARASEKVGQPVESSASRPEATQTGVGGGGGLLLCAPLNVPTFNHDERRQCLLAGWLAPLSLDAAPRASLFIIANKEPPAGRTQRAAGTKTRCTQAAAAANASLH